MCFSQVSEGIAELFPRLLADLLVPAAAGAKGGDDEKQAESHMSDKAVRVAILFLFCLLAVAFNRHCACQSPRFPSAI